MAALSQRGQLGRRTRHRRRPEVPRSPSGADDLIQAAGLDLASERLSARLQDAGSGDAMEAALGKEPVLATGETPVHLLDPHAGLAEADTGAPHVLVVRTPHRGLTWLRALGSPQVAAITAILSFSPAS